MSDWPENDNGEKKVGETIVLPVFLTVSGGTRGGEAPLAQTPELKKKNISYSGEGKTGTRKRAIVGGGF